MADMVIVLSSKFLEEEESMTLPAPVPSDNPNKAKKGVLRFSDVGDDSSEEVYKSGWETRAAPVPLDKPNKAKKDVLRFSDVGDDSSEEVYKSGSETRAAPVPLDKPKKAKKGVLRFSDVGDVSSEEVYKSGSEAWAAPVPLDKPKKAKKGVLRFSDAGDDNEEGCKSGSKTRAAPGRLFALESLSKTAESISTGFIRKPQAIKQRVKSYHENIASLRAAVVVMFPPKRRKILRSMRDFVQARQLSKITR